MFLDTLMCFVAPKIDDALIAAAIEAIEFIPQGIRVIVILMVILGRIECAGIYDLGCDRAF